MQLHTSQLHAQLRVMDGQDRKQGQVDEGNRETRKHKEMLKVGNERRSVDILLKWQTTIIIVW